MHRFLRVALAGRSEKLNASLPTGRRTQCIASYGSLLQVALKNSMHRFLRVALAGRSEKLNASLPTGRSCRSL
ncbi:hypothetical protein [Leptospira borgpetersenii]|uniref:hypothetical protein n=1 Tax=Leptospira borgpetersenii TaxID=174 RepID=UPI001D13DE4D|nr:hypothetical protein [Leptospira borgpetersenii]